MICRPFESRPPAFSAALVILSISIIALVKWGCGGPAGAGAGGGARGPKKNAHSWSRNDAGGEEPDNGTKPASCTMEKPCEKTGYHCFRAGPQPPRCGTRPRDLCRTDADCRNQGPGFICKWGHGLCGGRGCAPGCKKDADCAVYQSCQLSTHRCVTKTCSSAKDCPDNFTCGKAGKCRRKRCTQSSECEGYCVHKGCFPQPGVCRKPPPPVP